MSACGLVIDSPCEPPRSVAWQATRLFQARALWNRRPGYESERARRRLGALIRLAPLESTASESPAGRWPASWPGALDDHQSVDGDGSSQANKRYSISTCAPPIDTSASGK